MTAQDRAILAQMSRCSAVGSIDTVVKGMTDFINKTGADELMIVSSIFDHKKRLYAFEIAADAAQKIEE
jgi:hypothetical protein